MISLRYRRHELRLRHTFRLARGASDARSNLLVELEHEGLVGLGEAAPIERYAQDWRSAARAAERMVAALDDPRAFEAAVRRGAPAGQPAAQAAVDMALRDLAGKRLGAPLYELLGIDARRTLPTSFTIGMDSPRVVRTRVRKADEFEVLKIKLGSRDDTEILQAVRDATDKPLRVDANEGWTLEEAKARLELLEKSGVELVEQPLPAERLEETSRLRELTPLPLFADESVHTARDIPRLVGAFDGINIKLMKCGGVGEALRMIAVARAHGLQVMIGCMVESSLAITAAAHLSPLVDFADLDGNLLIVDDPFVGARIERGRLVLPAEPGLGVRPREIEARGPRSGSVLV